MEAGAIAFDNMVRELNSIPPMIGYDTYLAIKAELRHEAEIGFDSADERAEVLKAIAEDFEVSPGVVAWMWYMGV
jgi:hypothetical protein